VPNAGVAATVATGGTSRVVLAWLEEEPELELEPDTPPVAPTVEVTVSAPRVPLLHADSTSRPINAITNAPIVVRRAGFNLVKFVHSRIPRAGTFPRHGSRSRTAAPQGNDQHGASGVKRAQ